VQVTWKKGTPQARFHDASFADAPDYMVKAIVKYDDQLKEVRVVKNGGTYYSHRRTIDTPEPDGLGEQGTWRHEYGHFLDSVLSDGKTRYRSSKSDFRDILDAETTTILNNAGFGRKSKAQTEFNIARQKSVNELKGKIESMSVAESKIYLEKTAKDINFNLDSINEMFSDETPYIASDKLTQYRKALMLEAIKNKDAASFMASLLGDTPTNRVIHNKGNVGNFSDLIGSASKNKLLGHGSYGNGGHTNAYFRKDGERYNAEVFANLTSLYGAQNKFWTDIVDLFYPELGKFYKGLLNE
jgi:hypothetical protein